MRFFIFLSALFLNLERIESEKNQSKFYIDYENNTFIKNGRPYRFISGSMHYFRIPAIYWKDRLSKLKSAGLNAVQTYIPWNFHENFPNEFDFSTGERNLSKFISVATDLDLDLILRIGPYSCGEWENGGLPWWLLKTKDIRMRSFDQRFLTPVKRWFTKLMSVLEPFLIQNGGRILMLQIENEYGSFDTCDVQYTGWLRDTVHELLGYDTLLVSVDGGSLHYLKCGFIPTVYPTVDFGPTTKSHILQSFAAERVYAPRGPLVNLEFYPGWLDKWGRNFTRTPIVPILDSMSVMWSVNASFNFYMFHGGTNFGFTNSYGWTNPVRNMVTTTYDYDAPISEAGDLTLKYQAIRNHMKKNLRPNWSIPPVSTPNSTKASYGKVRMHKMGDLEQIADWLKKSDLVMKYRSRFPLSHEDLNLTQGFVIYETEIPSTFDSEIHELVELNGTEIKDRGYLLKNGEFLGTIVHLFGECERRFVNISVKSADKIRILTENMGRSSSGHNDPKGIIGNVTVNGEILQNWTMTELNYQLISKIIGQNQSETSQNSKTKLPAVYSGHFWIDKRPLDTFLDPSEWSKGHVSVNGQLLGWFWPRIGPQVRLYVPKSMLRKGRNEVVIIELENNLRTKESLDLVGFVEKPYLDKVVEFLAC